VLGNGISISLIQRQPERTPRQHLVFPRMRGISFDYQL